MNAQTIDQLKTELKIVEAKRTKILNDIEQHEINKLLPGLRKKYEGKYFKFKNRYSDDDWWWMYSYCIEVKNQHFGIFNTFQSMPNGKFEIELGDQSGWHLCIEQITKREYEKAVKIFLQRINKIKP